MKALWELSQTASGAHTIPAVAGITEASLEADQFTKSVLSQTKILREPLVTAVPQLLPIATISRSVAMIQCLDWSGLMYREGRPEWF